MNLENRIRVAFVPLKSTFIGLPRALLFNMLFRDSYGGKIILRSVVVVFMGNRTVIDFLITPITNIRCSIQTIATFFFEVFTRLVTSRTGRTFNPTKNNFVTSIRFSTMISMNTEVLFIDERAFMIPVRDSSCFNFFRDSSWIFAEESCNIFKCSTFV